VALKTVVAVMTDLFFLVQVTAAAKPLGFQVVCVKDKAAALEKVQAGDAALVIDLTCTAAEPLDLIREAKAAGSVTVIGFLPHVQTALREQALDAGCDSVLPRSAFAQKLPELLRAIT
jgi:CheY-like chemotaxis protein